MDIIKRTMDGERLNVVELPVIRKDGKVSVVLWNSATLYEPDGKTISSTIAQGQDITSRKAAEAENIRAREEWERTFNTVPDLIAILDASHLIIRVNKSMADRLGTTPEKCVGLLCHEVVHGTAVPPEFCPHAKTCADGKQHIAEVHEPGLGGTFIVSTTPLFNPDGDLLGTVHVAHDITDRKRSEEELQRRLNDLSTAYEEITATQEELHRNVEELSLREQELLQSEAKLKDALTEKEILLSEIHHRVKNNLAAFISLLSLDGTYEETDSGRALKKDLQNRARSMALIHETLYRTGKFSNVDMQIYLTTLVEQIAATFRGNVAVDTVVDAKGVVLDLARATTAGLIINELVTNSFKYAFPPSFDCMAVRGEPCTVRVAFTEENGSLLLSVADNGRGLPRDLDPLSAKSLGLRLVNFLGRHQLRAEIAVRESEGTEFMFRFDKTEDHA
jgi:PAS domain S-box-containing protein